MRALRIVVLIAVMLGSVSLPSRAEPECDLFLISGPGVDPHHDLAIHGCMPGLPGGPYDASVLMPGARTAFGWVSGRATPRTPTRARVVIRDIDGNVMLRAPMTFRRVQRAVWGGSSHYLTDEFVEIPLMAMTVVIRARFNGRWHRHEYGRLMPPSE